MVLLTAPAASGQSIEPDPGIFAYDVDLPLDIRIAGRDERSVAERIDLSYTSPAGGRVPAFLYVPVTEGPHAGLLLMHGMPGSRTDLDQLAMIYARQGAVVLSISAPFARPDGPRPEPVTFTSQDRAEQIQLIQDLMRGVDLLLARDDVDPERLGYVGGSYGGAMGGLLAGVENRIKAYALFVGDGGLVAHFSGPEDAGQVPAERMAEWIALMNPIEPLHYVGRAAPAELLFQQGRHDRMVPAADAEAFVRAGSEPKQVIWYDSGHGFSGQMMQEQVSWLSERLELRRQRER